MERIFAAAESLAKEQLTKKWSVVRALVGELYAKGSVDEVRFRQIELGSANARVNNLNTEKNRILPDSRGAIKSCRLIFE